MATQVHQSLAAGKTRVCFVPSIQCQSCTARYDSNRKHSFRFWAEGQKFSAGEYIFDTGFPGSTSAHRKRTKTTIAVPVIIYRDPVGKKDAKIVLVLRHSKHYLVELWCVSDRRVVTAEFDHRGQTATGQREVQLT